MKQIKLQVPESTYSTLTERANKQGVSIEMLCISLLEAKCTLVEPNLYPSLGSGELKEEIRRILQSSLLNEEKNRRIKQIELNITRRIR